MATEYEFGHAIRLSCEFRLSDVLTDPTAVTLRLTPPQGGSFYASGIVNDSTGKYHLDYVPPVAGPWQYRFRGTGAVEAADEKPFYVKQSED